MVLLYNYNTIIILTNHYPYVFNIVSKYRYGHATIYHLMGSYITVIYAISPHLAQQIIRCLAVNICVI
jgi:hypothetical protein